MILKHVSQRSMFELLLQIIGLAAAYFVTGKLGNLLAIPPGYATIVFPASGISLAGVLLYGNRAFWGILLGSFLFNASISVISSDFSESLNPILISLAIAIGSGVQAIVGAYLVRRFAGFPNEFSDEKSILLFLFYGGFVSALVNSTFSVSLLVATGRIPIEDIFANWLTWWGGDALGIMIFTPLSLIWMSHSDSFFQGRRLVITLPILMMFFMTIAAVFYEIQSSNERIKIGFEKNTNAMNIELNSSLTTNLNVLRSLKSFYSASKTVNSKEFKTFVTQSLEDFKGVQALGWNRRVLDSEREEFEKSMRLEGYSNFKITERDADKKLVRAGNRPEYYPVAIIEPFKTNEKAVGYDIYSDEIRHEAIERAVDIDALAMTAKIILVQEKEKQNGFLAFMPIYRDDLPHETVEERRKAVSGLVTAVLRGGDIIKAALNSHDLAGLSYRLMDITTPTEELIFASDEKKFTPFVLQRKSILGGQQTLIYSTIIPIGGRLWRFDVVPKPIYFVENRSTNAWLILLGGIALTVLTSLVSLVSAARRRVLENLVNKVIVANEGLVLANGKSEILYQKVNHMQKLESIGRMTSGIAHDFNNILACMLGFNGMNECISEDITDEILKAALENNTRQINDAGQRAIVLINKMLIYSRQQDQPNIKRNVQPTKKIISEVLEMLRPALTRRIKLEFENKCRINNGDCENCGKLGYCDEDIQIDAMDLHQILTNLAVNARDAMKEHGNTITISLKKVTNEEVYCAACAESVLGRFIELSVTDNGSGMDAKILPRLFDPFFTTKPQGEGTGLGLSTVSGMVHQSGGHILIDSNMKEPNRGTAFRLLFPLVSNQ